MADVIARLRSVADYHAVRASYGGIGAEHHMRMQTSVADAATVIQEARSEAAALQARAEKAEADVEAILRVCEEMVGGDQFQTADDPADAVRTSLGILASDRGTARAALAKAEAENAAWRADYLHIAEALGRVHEADYIYVPADLPTLLKRIAELAKAEAERDEALAQLHTAVPDLTERCATCGHPRGNHPYRHMFKSNVAPVGVRNADPKAEGE